ncbi:MAG: LysR family transcriptional regulator [Ruminococcus sp.]|jgi:LysR family transcriptional repressor of citA|nr:LysR family transcriptional regulator [Ruminococcus sp.]
MNTENLKTFIALSKHKNFTKTAESLFVAQSTVTNRIAELEKEVGKKLFERERKNVRLTEEGTRFLDYAVRITDLEKTAIEDININEKYPKRLNIGSTNTIYDCHLKNKLKSFMSENPDTALKVIISHSASLVEMTVDGVVDFAFTCMEYHKNNIKCVPFCEDEMVLVTDSKNTAYADGISLTQLAEVNYLYCNFTFQGIGEYIRDLFPKHNRFSFEIDRSANIIPYLFDSDSYSFLPKELVSHEIANGRLCEIPIIDFEIPRVKSFMVYNEKSRLFNEKFLDELYKL